MKDTRTFYYRSVAEPLPYRKLRPHVFVQYEYGLVRWLFFAAL